MCLWNTFVFGALIDMPKTPTQVCRRCAERSNICRHTKAGRAVLDAQVAMPVSLPASAVPVGSILSSVAPSPSLEGAVLQGTMAGASSPPDIPPALPPLPLFPFTPSLAPSTPTSVRSFDATSPFSEHSSSSDFSPSSSSDSSPSHTRASSEVNDVPIDPFLLPSAPAPAVNSTASSVPSTPSRPRKERVTDGRYGYVEGCMRGKQPYVIPRPKPLRAVEADSRKSSKRFGRELPILIARFERLAVEAGCWILVHAQHANAAHPAIHYASPKLRLEALQSTKDLSTQFAKVTNALIATRRSDALALAQRLQDLQSVIDAAVQDSDNARNELSRERTRATAMEAMLTRLGVEIPAEELTDPGSQTGGAAVGDVDP